jgi:biopolymer transport protein ExbB/TolQ
MAKSTQNNRQELDLNLPTVIGMTVAITVIVYVVLWPFQTSYLGVLLYQRGFTQYLVVILASFVISTTINKFIKISLELQVLKENWLPENISFNDYKNPQLLHIWQELARSPRLIAARCTRIIGAYINSGSRKAATELALDDSSFYLTASESSYALPRILVWAIPLLGFIGTVLGISTAVNGFSAFLENTAEIDQIKEGIGTVTSGLAVAFDTTLLALFLSVVVMIPLVLVERLESKLLLQIDVYINDKLLPRLKEQETKPLLDTEKITLAVGDAIKENLPTRDQLIQPIKDALPSPEQLIKPAEKYAQKAANRIAESFISQFGEIQAREKELIQAITQVNLIALDDREEFMSSFSQQQKLNHKIIQEIQNIVETLKDNGNNLANGLKQQAVEISNQLNQAANNLENKVKALEISTSKIAELNQMHSSLEKIVSALEKTVEMEETFSGIRENILTLQPILKELGKPRIIKLVEQIEQDQGLEKDG